MASPTESIDKYLIKYLVEQVESSRALVTALKAANEELRASLLSNEGLDDEALDEAFRTGIHRDSAYAPL